MKTFLVGLAVSALAGSAYAAAGLDDATASPLQVFDARQGADAVDQSFAAASAPPRDVGGDWSDPARGLGDHGDDLRGSDRGFESGHDDGHVTVVPEPASGLLLAAGAALLLFAGRRSVRRAG